MQTTAPLGERRPFQIPKLEASTVHVIVLVHAPRHSDISIVLSDVTIGYISR